MPASRQASSRPVKQAMSDPRNRYRAWSSSPTTVSLVSGLASQARWMANWIGLVSWNSSTNTWSRWGTDCRLALLEAALDSGEVEDVLLVEVALPPLLERDQVIGQSSLAANHLNAV